MAGTRPCGIQTTGGKPIVDGTLIRSCSSVPGVVANHSFAQGVATAPITVYLGGAGMAGNYVADQVTALREAGIKNPVAGVFTRGMAHDGGMLSSNRNLAADALASAGAARHRAKTEQGFESGFPYGPYNVTLDWSLKTFGINTAPPKLGAQFNLIGYSYGSLIAAQSALFYADAGYQISYLVLVASPISKEFLNEIMASPGVSNVIFVKINTDEIYPGMTEMELIRTVPKMIKDIATPGTGHFYFSADNAEGRQRRRNLAAALYAQGLR